MKNLTRVLALVLVFSLMISSVAFAATFTDVKTTDASAEAIQTLADLGILKGYEDGTFGPDKVITRAEAVAVINRLQGLEQAAKGAAGVTPYTDVKADHWATGDINLATQMGIISGDGNGLFRPEDQVSYEEIVKMVVVALGYAPAVADKGGWPTGYLVIASDIGITKGLSNSAGTPAPRGTVAKIVFQALDAPMMEQVGYGSDATYQKMDGKGGNAKKIPLTEKLSIYKLYGQVVANNVTSIDGTSAITSTEPTVRFEISDDLNIDNDFDTKELFLVGNTTADKNLGYASIAYVEENDDGDYVILSIATEAKKNVVATIENVEDIQSTTAANDVKSVIGTTTEDMYLSVYDSDVDNDNTEYDIASNAKVIVNGEFLSAASSAAVLGDIKNATGVTSPELGKYYAPKSGSVTLLDNNKDDKYDYIFVKSYDTVIVEEIYNKNTKISTKFSGIIDLDLADVKNAGYTLTLDGKAAKLEDLQEWDVLSIAKAPTSRNYEIIATRKSVTGTIEEIDKGTKVGTEYPYISNYELVIDGTQYKPAIMSNVANTNITTSVDASDEGVFYIDSFGKIAYFDKRASTSKNYGFIVSVGKDSGMDNEYTVRMLGADGKLVDYILADNVRVYNNTTNGSSVLAKTDNVKAAALYGDNGTTTPATTIGSTYTNVGDLPSLAKLAEDKVITDTASAANAAKYAKRLVTFSSNSSGKLTAITFANTSLENDSYFTHNGTDASGKYNAKTQSIGDYGVSNDTVVFFLPIETNASKDDFEVRTISSLADEQEYNDVHFFSVDKDGNAGAIMITSETANIGDGSTLAVVTKVMNGKNTDLENVKNITFIKDGKEQTLSTTSDLYNALDSISILKGDLFEYSVNAKGEIDKVEFNGVTNEFLNYDSISLPIAYNNASSAPDTQYVFGIVYNKNANRIIQIGALGNGNTLARHTIPTTANVYVVDLNKSNTATNKVLVGAYGDVQASYFDPNGDVDKDQDISVLLKYYKGEVIDVVVYKGYITNK